MAGILPDVDVFDCGTEPALCLSDVCVQEHQCLAGREVSADDADDDDAAAAVMTQALSKHPSNAVRCDLLHRIIVGRRAEELLDGPIIGGRLMELESWWWARSSVKTGRKERPRANGDGVRYALPVRVVFESGPLVVLQPGERRFPWWAVGMGHARIGELRVMVGASADVEPVVECAQSAEWMVSRVSGVLSKFALVDRLQQLVDSGRAARWEFIQSLERSVSSALRHANSSLAQDLSDFHGVFIAAAVDDISIQTLRNVMMFGDPDSEVAQFRSSAVSHIVDRCTTPGAFASVDPARFLQAEVYRTAQQHLGRMVGDPRVGRKVRKVALEVGSRDPDVVVAAYRKVYPSDRLEKARCRAALETVPFGWSDYPREGFGSNSQGDGAGVWL